MKLRSLLVPVLVAVLAAGAGYLVARRGASAGADLGVSAGDALQAMHGGGTGAAGAAALDAARKGKVLVVKDGESIQAAVLQASAGDTVQVMPGTYKETVYIDKDDIAIVGVIRGDAWPTLEGEGKRNDAVLYSGNGVRVENLKINAFKGNGIMGQAGNNFVIRHNWIVNAGVYGIFPELGQNGLVEQNILTGIEDAAIYIGMSDNIHVAHNEVFGNVAGIEIENSRHAIVEDNMVTDNAGGILAFITPGLPIKTCQDVIIRHNFVLANNHKNFAAPGSIVSGVPPGSGVVIMAADDVVLDQNIIRDNKNAGVIIIDHKMFPNVTPDPEADPNPDRVQILQNFFANNGTEPISEVKALMLTELTTQGPDVIATGARDSCALDRSAFKAVGLGKWAVCQRRSTADVATYLLDHPVAPRRIETADRGKLLYSAICAGCHATNQRLVGPAVQAIQAIYEGNPQGIADFIAKPVKKRDDYPAMPPQAHLSPEMRLAVAQYMLGVK